MCGDTHVDTGRLIGDRGVCDRRIVQRFLENVFHVFADGRLARSEFDEHVEGMHVGYGTRELKVAFNARYRRVVHHFERREGFAELGPGDGEQFQYFIVTVQTCAKGKKKMKINNTSIH